MKPDAQSRPQNRGTNQERSIQNLNLAVGAMTVFLLLYAAAVSWYSWTDEKAESTRDLTSIVELEARAIDSYFTQLEAHLKALGDELAQGQDPLDLDRAYLLVQRFKTLHSELYNATLIGPDGEVLLSAKNPPGSSRASLAKEPSFIMFLEELKQGKSLGIGQPLVGVVTKAVIVPIRYAVTDRQGRLRFIVSANLPHEHLRSFWMDAPITAKAAIGLMRDNGYLLSRYPVPANLSLAQIYGQPRTGALITQLRQQDFPERGFVQGPSSLDGPDFLNAFHRLPHYPVTLFVALPMSEIREAWWRRVSGTYLALLILLFAELAAYTYAARRQHAWNETQMRLEASRQESENALRESEAHLNAAQQIAHFGSWDWDVASGAIRWSDEQYRIFGFEPGEVSPSYELFLQALHADDRAKVKAALDAALAGVAPYDIDCRILLRDGTLKYLHCQGEVTRDAASEVAHMTGTVHDRTERKKLDAERDRMLKIIEQSPDFIAVSDMQNRLKYINASGLGLVGLPENTDVATLTIMDMHPEWATRRVLEEGVPAVLRHELWQGETALLHRDGHETPVSQVVMIHRDESGNPELISTIMRDITPIKRHEKELEVAKEAAESANLVKSRFLATMSHEIRTPLNGILGMAQMLLSPKLDDAVRIDYARTVLNSGHTLLTLLNDILDLSKVEAGKVALETIAFAPGQILQETRALFEEAARAKGLQIRTEQFELASQHYLGDPHRLRQMLSNLANNAVKFTTQGQIVIEVQESGRDERSALLEFSVTDSGIGIPEDKRQLLFQPFSQTDNSTARLHGGSGLGLSIVSSLAKLMGGEVGVDSEPGRGSRFWFRIRARRVAAGEDNRQTARPESKQPVSTMPLTGRVLVAEDDPTNRKVALALLTRIGLSVVFAEDGQQALDAISGGEPVDLILMDVHMPHMDGYQATERIRQWEAESGHRRHPIIALTADAFEADQQKCLALGMDDFLSKPIAVNTLRAVLGKWLPAHETHEADAANTADAANLPATNAAGVAGKTADMAQATAIWRKLEPLLEHNQFGAISQFKLLQAVAAGTELAAELDAAWRLLEQMRFDETLGYLRHLAQSYAWQDPAA